MHGTPSCVLPSYVLAALLPAFMPATCFTPATLTVVLDFKGPHSPRSVEAMKREAEGILKPAGLRLEWKDPSEAKAGSFSDLVVVQFKGTCMLEPQPYLYDELGPLGSTFTMSGAVQPFSEVACDKVSVFVRSELKSSDFSKTEAAMGKALGRVVAHELVHMLTRSGKHSHGGVFKPTLTVEELVAGELPLDPSELHRLRDHSRLAQQ
jgi:hypothetical protein